MINRHTPVKSLSNSKRLHTYAKQLAFTASLLSLSAVPSASLLAAEDSPELDRSIWSISSATGNDPLFAIDGDIGSRWTTQLKQQPGQVLTLNFGTTQNVDRIVMLTNNGQSYNQDYPRGFEIHLSADGQDWGDAVATGEGSPDHTTVIDFPSRSAKFLRITQTGATTFHWWSIHELKAYGSGAATDTGSGSNIISRANWTVSASNNDSEAGNAIDSSVASRWTTRQPQQNGQTFTIDLNDNKLVDRILMRTNDNNAFNLDHPRSYEVHLSDDGLSWGEAVASGIGGPGAAMTDIGFTKQPARFVRITQTGGDSFYWWSIHDLNLYGSDNTTPDNNVPVANFVAPTPADNQTLDTESLIRIAIDAGDDDGFVESVKLYINNQLISQKELPPYEWDSQTDAQLSDLSEGVYQLRAEVTDNLGAVSTAARSFVISATVITPGTRHPDIVTVLDRPLSDIPYGPDPIWWGDSYSVGDQCFCETTFDHDIDVVEVETPLGSMNVRQACELLGPGPGSDGRPKYNDVQCGNGPVNGTVDEAFCPGQINVEGTDEQRRLGCNNIGPTWKFEPAPLPDDNDADRHPDIVSVLDRPVSAIPYGPDPQWWGDSYSVGDQCFCETTFDHDIGDVQVETPIGTLTVRQACGIVGPGPGSEGRPKYNDVQCGNGPVNGTDDEAFCPGQINVEGTIEEMRLGCNNVGPTWKF